MKGNTTCCAKPPLTPNGEVNGTNIVETNGHAINEHAMNGNVTNRHGSNGHQSVDGAKPASQLFVLSSPEQAAVNRLAHLYADYLSADIHDVDSDGKSLKIDDLAYTLSDRRSNFQWRVAFVANSLPSLQELMAAPSKVVRASNYKSNSLLFVFTGQGAQYYAMGRALLYEATFAASVRAADAFFNKSLQAGWSVLEELTKAENESRINSAKFSQPLCTVLQVALVDLFRSWGIKPAAVVGHSSGEIGKNVLNYCILIILSANRQKLRHTRHGH